MRPHREGQDASRSVLARPLLLGAHRGGGGAYPENTVFAFSQSSKRWPGILLETDARLTADRQVVLLHDETVDRTTDGTGPVNALTLEEVKALDAGYDFTRVTAGRVSPIGGKGSAFRRSGRCLTRCPRPGSSWISKTTT